MISPDDFVCLQARVGGCEVIIAQLGGRVEWRGRLPADRPDCQHGQGCQDGQDHLFFAGGRVGAGVAVARNERCGFERFRLERDAFLVEGCFMTRHGLAIGWECVKACTRKMAVGCSSS